MALGETGRNIRHVRLLAVMAQRIKTDRVTIHLHLMEDIPARLQMVVWDCLK